MTVVFVIGFALAAGLGGVARWYAARLSYLPEVATFGVNVIGSFLLGAFTTFSTFVHDVVRLAREGAAGYLIAYTTVECIAAALLT